MKQPNYQNLAKVEKTIKNPLFFPGLNPKKLRDCSIIVPEIWAKLVDFLHFLPKLLGQSFLILLESSSLCCASARVRKQRKQCSADRETPKWKTPVSWKYDVG